MVAESYIKDLLNKNWSIIALCQATKVAPYRIKKLLRDKPIILTGIEFQRLLILWIRDVYLNKEGDDNHE